MVSQELLLIKNMSDFPGNPTSGMDAKGGSIATIF